MELFIVQFYDENESGNVEHNEVYTSEAAAQKRYNGLSNSMNCYSWVRLWTAKSVFGRLRCDECIGRCDSCNGKDDHYHGDDSDF